jgi:hypothetical protein
MRAFEQPFGIGVLACSVWISKDPREQAGDGVDDDQCWKLPPCEHEIANGQLIVHQVLPDAFVHPLIPPTDQGQAFHLSQLHSCGLGERPSLGGEQDHRTGGRLPENGFYRAKDGFWFHHHPATAPVRDIISGPVPVRRPIAYVVQADVQQSAFLGALQDAGHKVGLEDLGEEGENVEVHALILAPTERVGKQSGRAFLSNL